MYTITFNLFRQCFNTLPSELFDDSQSVYLRLWYEGAEMAKPYNDPRQMERTLAAHKV